MALFMVECYDREYMCWFVIGAFLITYGIAMVFCGIPIFFQEVAIGQYLGAGGMTLVGQLCPLLQGTFLLLLIETKI